ncbi:lipopolysaccharide-induced tumor necrosis factor-alpha factor homolog [Sitophilus oryzae]|uniref:Lipopolysaccharide-induced tumor necrosis factor-alpha factor homolog n=1 Tax=Sitophilus oryzae TaxID=7048 RepID=A0A6J2YQ53_SITOR|nr:lipopolysaccharide-induced tumor necrosis factor-alpha factor homolog [Sitophilus oryzae]
MSDKDNSKIPRTTSELIETTELSAPEHLEDQNVRAVTHREAFLELINEERTPNLVTTSQPNLRSPYNELASYKNTACGIINSTSAMHNESYVQKTESKISLSQIPPSYSTVLKLGPPITIFNSRTYASVPFIARPPPPSYAEVHGWDDNPSIVSSDSMLFGPGPTYLTCPRCRTVIISDVRPEHSCLSYLTSFILCLCLCWPCCLLPFCLRACSNVYHYCPRCNTYLGVYKPC